MPRRLCLAVLSALFTTTAMAADPTTQPARPYRNPVVRGLAPDPSVCRVDDDFYLAVSTMNLYPGVPILHSRALVHWRTLGHALTTPGQMGVDRNGGEPMMFAPTLGHHGGTFDLACTDVHGWGNFIVTATDPKLYSFAWSADGTVWHEAGTGRAQLIGTETAVVWSGVLLGVTAAGRPADVDWCEYATP